LDFLGDIIAWIVTILVFFVLFTALIEPVRRFGKDNTFGFFLYMLMLSILTSTIYFYTYVYLEYL